MSHRDQFGQTVPASDRSSSTLNSPMDPTGTQPAPSQPAQPSSQAAQPSQPSSVPQQTPSISILQTPEVATTQVSSTETHPPQQPQGHIQIFSPNPDPATVRPQSAPQLRTPSSTEKVQEQPSPGGSGSPLQGGSRGHGVGISHAVPKHPPRALTEPGLRRTISRRSEVDWIVPVEEEKKLPFRPKTLGERLQATLDTAIRERDKYAAKAKMTAYALNIAIGLQVLLGALTTGLSAVTTGRNTSISTSVLGGLSTLVASYLARARGSNEPELSIARVKDLEQFIRECQAFIMDYGHLTTEGEDTKDKALNEQLHGLRRRFEDLLGNASGERKLSPPA